MTMIILTREGGKYYARDVCTGEPYAFGSDKQAVIQMAIDTAEVIFIDSLFKEKVTSE